METENKQKLKLDKYRQLLGVQEDADLPALKECYAALFDKFEAQLHSGEATIAQKGRKNMQLLDQAFAALAADIRTREMATSTNDQSSTDMTVEHGSIRVGFQILEGGSKFFVMERTRASVFGSTRTNNILSFSWPAGKLTLYDDHLELKCLPGSHQVSFYNVDAIDKAWYIPFWLRFKQKT